MAQQNYQGSCHCGAVKYAVAIDLDQPVVTCNCSMCGRAGTMLAFVPETAFKLQQGDKHLASYKFNKQVVDHVFCKTCGIKSFARGVGQDGTLTAAINVRCLEGVDLSKLKTHQYDGAAH